MRADRSAGFIYELHVACRNTFTCEAKSGINWTFYFIMEKMLGDLFKSLGFLLAWDKDKLLLHRRTSLRQWFTLCGGRVYIWCAAEEWAWRSRLRMFLETCLLLWLFSGRRTEMSQLSYGHEPHGPVKTSNRWGQTHFLLFREEEMSLNHHQTIVIWQFQHNQFQQVLWIRNSALATDYWMILGRTLLFPFLFSHLLAKAGDTDTAESRWQK